jgi:DNA-binding NarL/FixJ family response regulator
VTSAPIRLVVADDEELIRSGFRVLLDAEPDLEVIAEVADGRAAVLACRDLRPDVALLDVRMPKLDGIAAAAEILRLPDAPRLIMLTTFDRDEYVHEALSAGVSGFLLKTVSPVRLAQAVRQAAAGETLLAPQLTRRLVDEFISRPRPRHDGLQVLTEREVEVLVAVAKGRSNAEIASSLFLSEATVKTYLSRILAKLSLRDRAQAVSYAYETGLVRPGK